MHYWLYAEQKVYMHDYFKHWQYFNVFFVFAGILVNMFNQLYVDGIFTQESFIQWKKSAVDIEGKGMCFYLQTWLPS